MLQAFCKSAALVARGSGEISGVTLIGNVNSTATKLSPLSMACALSIAALAATLGATPGQAMQAKQYQVSTRKVKVSMPPEYPELARKMNIQGLARVLLTVAPEGRVVSVKELGGHPVLVAALVDAVKKWKYEAADRESTIEVRFEFR